MNRILSFITAVARLGTLASVLVLIGAVLIQVVARTFLPQAPVWTEELSRMALMYLVAFGVGLSVRTGDLVNVDILLASLPRGWRRALESIAFLMTAAMGLVIILPGFDFAAIGEMQTSPALEWRMDFVFVSMPIAAIMLMIFAVERAINIARGKTQTTSLGGL